MDVRSSAAVPPVTSSGGRCGRHQPRPLHQHPLELRLRVLHTQATHRRLRRAQGRPHTLRLPRHVGVRVRGRQRPPRHLHRPRRRVRRARVQVQEGKHHLRPPPVHVGPNDPLPTHLLLQRLQLYLQRHARQRPGVVPELRPGDLPHVVQRPVHRVQIVQVDLDPTAREQVEKVGLSSLRHLPQGARLHRNVLRLHNTSQHGDRVPRQLEDPRQGREAPVDFLRHVPHPPHAPPTPPPPPPRPTSPTATSGPAGSGRPRTARNRKRSPPAPTPPHRPARPSAHPPSSPRPPAPADPRPG